jgi:parallel beta-helix repeat protein
MTFYYASSAVSSGGAGTIGDPWDLRTAFSNGSQTSGDTLYLRGGTYSGKFLSTLDGGTVRSYPGEWAVIDGNATTTLTNNINDSVQTFDVGSTVGMFGSLVLTIDDEDMHVSSVVDSNTVSVNRGWNGTAEASHLAGATIYHSAAYNLGVQGNDTTYRDFEIKNSAGLRDKQVTRGAEAIGSGISVSGASDGNSFINLIIHDNGNGIFIGSATSNTLVYGNIVYNNGYINALGQPGGISIYAENASGYSRVYRNLFLNGYNGNAQFGGDSGPYAGGDHQYNVFANAGSPAASLEVNYLGRAEGEPMSVTDNHFFQPHNNSGGSASLFGYGDAITTLTLSDNYMLGGVSSCILQNITTISGSGNNLFLNDNDFGDAQMFYTPATLPTGTFNNNTYHKATGRDCFGVQGVGYVSFATWKTNTGFDAASSTTNVNMPDTVVVIPNEYESGRAHVVIYATSDPATIDVDLSLTGLTDGQTYEIKNAFDYSGTPVSSGVYDSGDPIVTLTVADMDGVVAPIGGALTPDTTAPDFIALVVEPTSQVGGNASISNVSIKNAIFS